MQVVRLLPHIVYEHRRDSFVHYVGTYDDLQVAGSNRHALVAGVLPEHQRRAGLDGRNPRLPFLGPPVHTQSGVDHEFSHAGSLWRRKQSRAATVGTPVQVHEHGIERPAVHVYDGCTVSVRREVPAWFVLVEQEVFVHPARFPSPLQSRLPQWVPLLDDHRRHHRVRAPPPQFVRDRRAVNLNCIRVAKRRGGHRRVPKAVTRTLGAFNQRLALGRAHYVVEDEGVEWRWKGALRDFGNFGARS
mmetsp:Transcript_9243/g.37834  ORF Transcript_9243/g.37834 Transcript_9243/m.37834 type:complete len:245 (-) Transcript_9243:140-874(-)